MARPEPPRVAKKPVVPRPRRKPKPKPQSLSAFVRDSLAGGKKADSRTIMDYFSGDMAKVDHFLERMDQVTRNTVGRSGPAESPLCTQHEWKYILDNIRLKFPGLTKNNERTLYQINRKLEALAACEELRAKESNVWSQASRQPSDSLTTDDFKWLYDLEDEQMVKGPAGLEEERAALQQETPFFLTLSQALDESAVQEDDTEYELSPMAPLVISDSEPEFEPYVDQPKSQELLDITVDSEEPISSHQQVPESINVLTSISFPNEPKKSPNKSDSVIFSSPVKAQQPKTPTKWPQSLVITSSPVQESPQEVFSTAKSEQSQEHIPTKKETPRKVYQTSTLQFQGHIDLTEETPDVKLRKLPSEPRLECIPDSEDENELSIIEISKLKESLLPAKDHSILEVPLSPMSSKLPFKEVKSLYSKLGLAPTKLKSTMEEALRYAASWTEHGSIEALLKCSEDKQISFGKLFQEKLRTELTNVIKSSPLHLKIALYQPVVLSEIRLLITEFPIAIDDAFLQRFCDDHGVTTTNERKT